MDRSALIDDLPDNLAVLVRLNDAGHPPETLACALGIPVQSVSIALRVASLKLAELSESGEGQQSGDEAVS